jgi:hypothetical protein
MSDPTSSPTNDPADEPATDGTDHEAGSTMDSTDSTTTYEPTVELDPDRDPAPAGARSGRHPVNIGHLVMGLAFAGLVVIWALIEGDVIADSDIRWLLPIPWVLAGTAGLLAVTLGNRRRRNP